ncbi:hypothetical protein B0O80DRAFT_504749 [Mortierella sp. GBAus27b]|nr:hypothetical protein B0O80DRAFT_504749 [Mortierella sp. GBAus27b]
MQLGDSSELSFDINLVKALQQSYEVQAVEQDSSSSASFSGSAQSNTLSCNDTVIYQTQMDMSLGINEFTHHTLDHGSQTAANHLPTFPVGLQAEDPKQTHQFWTSSRALPMWLQDSGASPTTDSWQLKQKRCRPQFMSPSSYLFPDKVRYSTEHQPYQASSDISKHYHSLTEGLSNANADNESNITSTDNNQSPLCTLQHGASFYLETMAYIGSQPLYFDSQNPDTTIGSDCSDSPRDQVDCLEVNSEHDERLTQVEPCVPGQPISIYNPTPRTLAVAQPMVSYDEDLSFEEHDIDNLRSSDTLGSDEYLLHMQHPQSLQLMHHHDEQSPRRNNMGPSHDDLPSAMCREEDTTQDVMNFLSELPPRSMYEPASSDTQPFSDPPDHHVFADEEEILLH